MWPCYGVHITVCMACLVFVLCQPVYSCIETALHGLDSFYKSCWRLVYLYINKSNRLFSALLLENLLLSVIHCLLFEFKHLQCGLLRPVSCTDRVIHTFPNRQSLFVRFQTPYSWLFVRQHTKLGACLPRSPSPPFVRILNLTPSYN